VIYNQTESSEIDRENQKRRKNRRNPHSQLCQKNESGERERSSEENRRELAHHGKPTSEFAGEKTLKNSVRPTKRPVDKWGMSGKRSRKGKRFCAKTEEKEHRSENR